MWRRSRGSTFPEDGSGEHCSGSTLDSAGTLFRRVYTAAALWTSGTAQAAVWLGLDRDCCLFNKVRAAGFGQGASNITWLRIEWTNFTFTITAAVVVWSRPSLSRAGSRLLPLWLNQILGTRGSSTIAKPWKRTTDYCMLIVKSNAMHITESTGDCNSANAGMWNPQIFSRGGARLSFPTATGKTQLTDLTEPKHQWK